MLLLLALQAALSRALPLDALIEEWSVALGAPVRVDSAAARLLPYPSVRLEGLAFESDITIERAVVELRILALLRGGLEGGRVRIRGAHVTLLRRADGSVQLGGIEADGETDAETGERAKPASRPRALPGLPHAELRDTVIRYVDHSVPSGQQVTELHLRKADVRTERIATSRPFLGSEKRHYDKSPGEIDLGTPIGGEFSSESASAQSRPCRQPRPTARPRISRCNSWAPSTGSAAGGPSTSASVPSAGGSRARFSTSRDTSSRGRIARAATRDASALRG